MTVTQDGNLQSRFEQHVVGHRKSLVQVGATVKFEFQRNLMNILISVGIAALFYVMNLIIQIVKEGRGVEAPTEAVEYLASYMGMTFGFFILIIAAQYGANIIAYDYDKQTGNLLFPKITKGRLFVGRMIARYLLSVLAVIVYYIALGISVAIKYGELPTSIWTSLGWAAFYMLAVLSLVVFFSSFMKKTSTVIVFSILMVLIVFQLTTTILHITGSEIEPLFILTYYSNIISESLTGIPVDRFVETALSGPGMGPGSVDGPTGMAWITPSISGAAIGLAIYSISLLTAAYVMFRRRQ